MLNISISQALDGIISHPTYINILRSLLTQLQQFQKRIICGFLCVNVNARNDIIDAISNRPYIAARQSMLVHRRTSKILSTWSLTDSKDFAYIFVFANRGIDGDSFVPTAEFNPYLALFTLKTVFDLVPVSEFLYCRFDGNLPISTLRWLL